VLAVGGSLYLAILLVTSPADSPTLEQQLLAETPAKLARAMREQGDPVRGAAIFYQPQLACAKCHEGATPLGPELPKMGANVTDEYLVESVLSPSKSVKKGYETGTISRHDGTLVMGVVAEDRPDAVVLRDPAQDGRLTTIPRAEIDEISMKGPSMMPPSLVNQLTGRSQFLDLVRYLREVADKGPERALRPAGPVLAAPPLPEYEKDLDHAGLITALDSESFKRGEAIYQRVCANCHGTKDKAGSLPTSLKFWSGKFKNGNDPYSMYRTLTHGFAQMPPQSWMVPRQRYDVIHYVREVFLRRDNPSQYAAVDQKYLGTLPEGRSKGPDPVESEPWREMDYGASLMATLEVGEDGSNFAYKAIAVRLDPGSGGISQGRYWAIYDHDTMRLAAAWEGKGFIDWNSIHFNGRHEIHPRIIGNIHVANATGLGWANPETGSFDDPRPLARDQRRYGPLPRSWARFRGVYHFGDRLIVSYTIGTTPILETPGLEFDTLAKESPIFTRTLNVGKSERELLLRVAPAKTGVALVGGQGPELIERGGDQLLRIPASSTPLAIKILMAKERAPWLQNFASRSPAPESLEPLTHGGPSRWPEVLKTQAHVGNDGGPFAADVLTHPVANPWRSRLRLTGLDFLPGGQRMAVCDWDGDVWLVDGIQDPSGTLTWRRIASGLFQPLGLKIVDGAIYITCRDQIAILRDLNGDGETDFVECFNDDHQVTDHFHEFAMDLERDAQGRFYYAKAARHGKTAVVPQHGTLLRVSADGSRTDILATGFRAPNGVCLNDDGTFFMTDQEGFWLPKNRINWVREGHFYGNMWGYHDITDPSDSAMEPPLCWVTNAFDRSPAQMLWANTPAWGPIRGSLLSLSYGYGKIFVVPHERVGDAMQGGLCALPIPQTPTGLIRARFHPTDGQLYTCGMFAWAGNQEQPGGLYRVRYTGKPVYLPIALNAKQRGMSITFSGALERSAATDPARYAIKTWSLKRTADYGSDHYDTRSLKVSGVKLSDDGRTVFIEIADLKPTWCMEIKYLLKGADGAPVDGLIHNTIHALRD
jgi:putative heme-binding domain-containing protein